MTEGIKKGPELPNDLSTNESLKSVVESVKETLSEQGNKEEFTEKVENNEDMKSLAASLVDGKDTDTEDVREARDKLKKFLG